MNLFLVVKHVMFIKPRPMNIYYIYKYEFNFNEKKTFFSNIRVLCRKNTDTCWNDFFLLQSVYTSLVVILNFIIIIALKIIFMHQKSFKLKSFRFYFRFYFCFYFWPYVVPLTSHMFRSTQRIIFGEIIKKK